MFQKNLLYTGSHVVASIMHNLFGIVRDADSWFSGILHEEK